MDLVDGLHRFLSLLGMLTTCGLDGIRASRRSIVGIGKWLLVYLLLRAGQTVLLAITIVFVILQGNLI